MYTVTATTVWRVDWTGGGRAGVIRLNTVATTAIGIDESQALN
jgi:hypothetical protein